jgi:hypothetical protein
VGILYDRFGFHVIYDARSNVNAKLSSVLHDGNWLWAPARSDDLVLNPKQTLYGGSW